MSSTDVAGPWGRIRFLDGDDAATAFLAEAGGFLAAHPASTTVVLTVADELTRLPPPPVDWPRWFAVLREPRGAVAGVAMRTAESAPHPPYVAPMPLPLAVALGRALRTRGEAVCRVNGEQEAAVAVARAVAGAADRVVTGMAQRLYEHRDQAALEAGAAGVPGRWRHSVDADLPLLREWLTDFHPAADRQAGRAVAGHGTGPALREETLRDRVATGRLGLWEVDGEPMSLAGVTAVLHGVGRVGPVYTPERHRGHGYAAAATAAATRGVLAAGARACLFTDAANPTSNALYRRLGYVVVGEFAQVDVEVDVEVDVGGPGRLTTPAPA